MANRDASSVFFGFDFQSNAAIVLMLENIREMSHIRLEGSEDIDITLNDGSHIFAQAKSVVKSSIDFKNVIKNLNKSIQSLSEAYYRIPDKVRELIYITNSPNPFNEKYLNTIFWGASQRMYSSLPPYLQEIVSKALNNTEHPLDTDKFKIQILPFETDNDRERYKVVISVIGDFISSLGNVSIERSQIHNIWATELFRSGTRKDQNINLKKKDLIWPIIVLITNNEIYDEFEIDDSDEEELSLAYKDIINTCSEKYEFVTQVLKAYNNTSEPNHKAKIEKFINTEFIHFSYLFDDYNITLPEDLKVKLLQIIIRNIVSKRRKIEHIKNTVNL